MINSFRFKNLTLMVFCFYLFWGFFGIDLTISGGDGADRLPLHRVFMLLTLFIFAFNIREVVFGLKKNILLVTLVFFIFLSSAWSSKPLDTIKGFIFLFSSLSISIMLALAFRDNQIKLIRGLFWLCFLMVAASVITAFEFPHYGINVRDFGAIRWIGITDHPNKLGALTFSCIWLAINIFYSSSNKLEKLISISAIIIAFFVVFKADSMTSIVASLFAIFYTSYLRIIATKGTAVKAIFFTLAILVSVIVTTFYMSTAEIANQTLASSGRSTTLSGRTGLWVNGFDAFSDNLLLGSGFDNLENLTKKYRMQMSHLHNGIIELLVKGGVIAGVLFIFIFLSAFFKQRTLQKIKNPIYLLLTSGLLSILLHNMAESSLFKGLNSLNLLLNLILVSTSIVYYDSINKKI